MVRAGGREAHAPEVGNDVARLAKTASPALMRAVGAPAAAPPRRAKMNPLTPGKRDALRRDPRLSEAHLSGLAAAISIAPPRRA